MRPYLTVTRKVILGYLVIIAFSLLAVGCALVSLRDHQRRTERLVGAQFQAFTLLQEARQNLLAQENLEKQLLILRDPQLLPLLASRVMDFENLDLELRNSALPDYFMPLISGMADYLDQVRKMRQVAAEGDWEQATALAGETTAPHRAQLLETLAEIRAWHQTALDRDLRQLSLQSSQAYRLTLTLTLVGILLSAPVALTVIASIHGSVKALQRATHEIAAGSFDTPINIRSRDEFGLLAQDFSSMAHKLVELEQQNLDANPLTRLPGNLAIDRELQRRIDSGLPFAHLYIDLDNFKAYSDRYGYKAGSDVIHLVGNLLREVVGKHGGADDLVGHIGGDDYVVMTLPHRAEQIAREVIAAFERRVPELYSQEDLEAGFIVGADRHGIRRTFPLLTMSIAVTLSENLEQPSLLTISHNCATMKAHLKQLKGSNYLIDRRKQLS